MNTLDFYRDLQNTCASGYDRITRLLSKAESEKLRTDMICQLEGYQRLSKVAESRLQEARANPQSISDYAGGKDRALGYLVGQVMKLSKGQANPGLANKMMVESLKQRIG